MRDPRKYVSGAECGSGKEERSCRGIVADGYRELKESKGMDVFRANSGTSNPLTRAFRPPYPHVLSQFALRPSVLRMIVRVYMCIERKVFSICDYNYMVK